MTPPVEGMGQVGPTWLLVVLVSWVLSEGCCPGQQPQRDSGLKNPPRGRYRVVQGDPFVMACVEGALSTRGVVWFRSRAEADPGDPLWTRGGPEGGSVVSRENLLKISALTAELSGRYWCHTARNESLDILLVVEKACSEPGPTQVTLTLAAGGEIYCPPSSCGVPEPPGTQVTWYKDGRPISQLQLDVCTEGLRLVFCTVYQTKTVVYSCDRPTTAVGPTVGPAGGRWTSRRAVNVTVIPPDTKKTPTIHTPNGKTTEEVVIGEPCTLLCIVSFGFQRTGSVEVQWLSSSAGDPGRMVLIGQQEEQRRERQSNQGTLVTQAAVLPTVTELHLRQVFTCLATNALGNTSSTTRLRRRDAAPRWLAVGLCSVGGVVLLACLVVALYAHSLELTLLYRIYWQSTPRHGADKKTIDVFLAHARSGMAGSDVTATSSLSGAPPPPYTPLEVLLRLLLEGLGYRLFLLERDLLPGGAYTEDVVGVIQRSRCLVCLLSADFLSNSSAVFVLEAGVQALLRGPLPRVLVIWTEQRPTSTAQLDPPLPRLVHRALRVLPKLAWLPGLPPDASRTFWKSVSKALPGQCGAEALSDGEEAISGLLC